MRIGLVLAAGGSVGVAYHGAVMSVLHEATGWDPRTAEIMVGTSAGSLSAAMLRAGMPPADLANFSEGESLSPEGIRLAAAGRPHRPRPSRLDALSFRPVADPAALLQAVARPWRASPRGLVVAALPSATVSTEALSAGVDALYQGQWPDQPLWVCSYDLRAGRRVVFGRPGAPKASVGQAVAASCAIPMYYRPVTIGGRRYVDGGVHSMINLDVVAGRGLDLVVAVSPMSQVSAWGPGVMGPNSYVRQALRLRLRSEAAALRRTGVEVVTIQPGRSVISSMGPNPMDASRRKAVSVATRESVGRWLRDGTEGRQLSEILRSAAGEAGERVGGRRNLA